MPVFLCCGRVGSVGGELGAWTRVWRSGVMLCLCESELCGSITGPVICVLCWAGSCAS